MPAAWASSLSRAQRQMTRDVHVGRPNLRTSSYVRKRQRHQRVMRHELQNARVKAA